MKVRTNCYLNLNLVGFYMKEKKSLITLLVSILVIIVGAVLANLVMTGFNTITVIEASIPTEDGQWSVADIYKPNTATSENKAPCIIVVPGFQRSKETLSSYSVELSRRGYVVITLDPYAQGDSSASSSAQAATTYGYGLYAWIDYVTLTDNMNYIDKDKVGALGHSAGGNACIKAASKYGQEVVDGVVAKSRLSTVYISGYVMTFTTSDLAKSRSNMGASYALYDEGAFRNASPSADVRYMEETILFVNTGLSLAGEDNVETIEAGRIYGNQYTNTLRIVNNEVTIHALQPYDATCIANMLDYFELTLDLDYKIDSSSQIWLVKELSQGAMLIALFLVIVSLASLLLKTNTFKSLVHEKPEKVKQTPLDMVFFWAVFAISATIACLDYIPCAHLAQKWFTEAEGSQTTWLFPQRMTNAIVIWAVVNGTIGLILFFGSHYLKKLIVKLVNKNKPKKDYAIVPDTTFEPLKVGFKEILKTICLGFLLFAVFYLTILVIYIIFHVDFRLFFISARPILLSKMLLVSLMYVPLFFIFYISNSIRVNCSMRPKNWPNWLSYLIAVLGNSVGLIAILAIQYISFASTGVVYYTDTNTDWLYVNILFGLIPMMMLLPVMNRFFYEKTGRAYLGPIVTCLIFIFMTLTNTVCYIPL